MINMLMSRFLYVLCWRNKVVIILIILSASMGMLITLSYHSNKHPSMVDEVLRNGKGPIPLNHHFSKLKQGKDHPGESSLQRRHYQESGVGYHGQHVQRKFLEKDHLKLNVSSPLQSITKTATESKNHEPRHGLPHITAPQGNRYNEGHQASHNKTGYKPYSPKLVSKQSPPINRVIDEVQMHPLIRGPNTILPTESDPSQKDMSLIDKQALEEIPFEKPKEFLQGSIPKGGERLQFKNKDNVQRVERHYGNTHLPTVQNIQSRNKINQRIVQMKSLLKSEARLKEYPIGESLVYISSKDSLSKKGARKSVLQPTVDQFPMVEGVNTGQPLESWQSKPESALITQSPKTSGHNQGKKMNHNQAWWKQRKQEVSDMVRSMKVYYLENVERSQGEEATQFMEHSDKFHDGHERHGSAHNQQVTNAHRYHMEQKDRALTGTSSKQQLALKGDVLPKPLTDATKHKLGSSSTVSGGSVLLGQHEVNNQNWSLEQKQVKQINESATQHAVGGDNLYPPRWQTPSTLGPHSSRVPDTPDMRTFLVNAPTRNSLIHTTNTLDNKVNQVNISNIILALARQRKPAPIFFPHHASTSYRPKDVWPELLEQWMETEEKYCDGHLIVMNSEFAVLKDVIIDRNFCHGRNGGEEIHEVLNQPEDEEYYTYFPGFFQLSCQVKPQYFFNNNNHLNQWLYSLNAVHDDHLYSEMRQEFTIALVRYEYANLYHTTTDFYNAFLLMEFFNKTQVETNILIIDGHPKGALDPVWDVLFNSSRRIDKQSTRTKYSHLVWSILGYNSPIMDHYAPNIPLVEEFRTFFLSSYQIKDQRKLACDKINILFIWRRDYIAHPRNPSGSISRKIQNEQELVVGLRTNFPLFSVKGIQIDLFEMDQQLAFIAETDVLIGMHGAGLTHAMFLPKHAGMIELLPTYWSAANEHFHAIARWRHLHYRQWVNANPQNEAPNHYTKIPPEVLNDLVNNMVKIVCGLATDPPDVFVEK